MTAVTVERPRKSSSYYEPQTVMHDAPGLTKAKGHCWADCYSGSADALIAAGFLSADMFPGQPGRNDYSHSYRPIGSEKARLGCWHRVPGYLYVRQQSRGRFFVELTMSREEQTRRETQAEAEWQARMERCAHTGAQAVRDTAKPRAHCALKASVEDVGIDEVQRMLDAMKPHRSRPRSSHLRLVAPVKS